jgi:hypothetical protein
MVLSVNCDFNWNLSMKSNGFYFFCLLILFLNVNIKISHIDDWTMFRIMLNYSLKIILKCKN